MIFTQKLRFFCHCLTVTKWNLWLIEIPVGYEYRSQAWSHYSCKHDCIF